MGIWPLLEISRNIAESNSKNKAVPQRKQPHSRSSGIATYDQCCPTEACLGEPRRHAQRYNGIRYQIFTNLQACNDRARGHVYHRRDSRRESKKQDMAQHRLPYREKYLSPRWEMYCKSVRDHSLHSAAATDLTATTAVKLGCMQAKLELLRRQ